MLKDSFYNIVSLIHQDNIITTNLQLNAEHEIFVGHFPGQPVVPGACLLQIVKEVLNNNVGADYRLKKADTLKFIAPVDPRMVDDLELKIAYKSTDAGLYITVVLQANRVVCFKMQGTFCK